MKFNIYGTILIVISIIFWVAFYSSLPASIPIHWDINGAVDSSANKLIVLLLFNGIMIMIYMIEYFVPKMKRDYSDMRIIINFIMTFFLAISLLILYAGLGNQISSNIILILLGVLFITLGIYIPKTKVNSRIKWIRKDEEALKKTNRFAGILFIIGGVVSMFTALLPIKIAFSIFIVTMLLIVIAIIIYSFIVSGKVNNKID